MAKRTLPFFYLFVLPFLIAIVPNHQARTSLSVLDRNGTTLSSFTDGDLIKLQIMLAGPVSQPTAMSFSLGPDDIKVAECTVAAGNTSCQTELFNSLGWYWSKSRQPSSRRTIRSGNAAADVTVAARPVVMVHGFGSSAEAWATYLGDKGYLTLIGIHGFAVGDGQVPGSLQLGNLSNPTAKTGTIASNAETLRSYIDAVKKQTGAQMVDLVAHSMGNLVSRYYIDRVMVGRDIAQMIMLGPPNEGTDCANLPASLGYYLPAALEIRPSYVRNIFNPQITRRHGVPFIIIAGTPIVEQIKSPCTAVPSDLAIALDSASGIQAPVEQSDAWHSDLNVSHQVFEQLVKPLLQKTAGEFQADPDPAAPAPPDQELQFTRVFTGHVNLGSSETQSIDIDNVAVASFALFDPTRSLTVTVHGATGNVIVLDAVRNGLVVVQDPETLVYLGYGFNNPRPGRWQVTLQATTATPAQGADYAILAQLKGGAAFNVQASRLLPKTGELVQLTARLDLGGQPIQVRAVQARIRNPNGVFSNLAMSPTATDWGASWIPPAPGLYGIDVTVDGSAPDGTPIVRSAFLSVEAQPTPEQFLPIQLALAAGVGALVLLVVLLIVLRLFQRGMDRHAE